MDQRYIPLLGDKLSRLGYGGMRFPKNEDGSLNYEAAKALLQKGYESGINYFDTAVVYHGGDSEKVFYQALHDYDRSTYYLADKMSIWVCKTEEEMKALFCKQLETLGTEYIDYYLVHALNRNHYKKVKQFHTVEFLLEMKRQGKIRHLGFSFHDTEPVLREIVGDYPWDFVQRQLNYLDWKAMHADRLYQVTVENHLPCMVMEPVRGGYLANLNGECSAILKNLDQEASMASWAMRFVSSLPNVAVVLSGMSDEEQIQDNCRTFSGFKELNPQEQEALGQVTDILCRLNDIPCTGCRYCMDCPQGVDIPEIFSLYSQFRVFGKAKTFTEDYKWAVDNGFGPDHCVSCGLCASRCPQQIDIPAQLRRIAVLYGEEKQRLEQENQNA